MKSCMAAITGLLTLLGTLNAQASESQWKAGVAKVVITPAKPMWMAGYAARTEPAQGKEHDLHAKALSLESPDGSRLVIVTLDLIGITHDIAGDVASRAEKVLGLPRHALLFNASHTHCGPAIRPERVELWGLPNGEAPKVLDYIAVLKRKIFQVVQRSMASMEPVELSFAQSSAGFAKNRRFPTENGYINQQYDDGPTDHDVPVLAVKNADGKLKAILFGYACHNTTLAYQKWCGDYAGFAQYELESQYPGAVAMFVMGAGGDQNPYPRREVQMCQDHGKALAQSVTRALESPQTRVTGNLRSVYDEVVLRFQTLPKIEDLRKQLSSSNKYERGKAQFLLDQLQEKGVIDLTYPCPVQLVGIGDQILLVAIGGEVVVDYSRRIKREFSKYDLVWMAGYSNDVFGYLPSLRVLNEGGYEGGGAMLYGPLPGPFEQDVEERVIGTVHRLQQELVWKMNLLRTQVDQ